MSSVSRLFAIFSWRPRNTSAAQETNFLPNNSIPKWRYPSVIQFCAVFLFSLNQHEEVAALDGGFSPPPLKCEDVLRWGGGVMRGKVSDCRCQLCFTSKAFFSFYKEMMARNCFGNFIPNVPSVIHTTVSSNQIISDRAR